MRKAVFLHGTGGNPDDHWWPWLKDRFEQASYEVWAPILPDNLRPNAQKYWEFLSTADWDFADNVLVGHSSGATSILNLLANSEFPRVRAVVLVGSFLNERLTKQSLDFPDSGQFADLFPDEGFDLRVIRRKASEFYFVHGDNDPYCAYEDAKNAAEEVGGELITVASGGHLSAASMVELPGLVSKLESGGVL